MGIVQISRKLTKIHIRAILFSELFALHHQHSNRGEQLKDTDRATAQKLIKAAAEEGSVIAIVGWRDSNHDSFTRTLKSHGTLFLQGVRGSRRLPADVGLVLFTRFLSHEMINKASDGRNAFNVVFPTGEIKRMLKAVEHLLLPQSPPQQQGKNSVATEQSAVPDEVNTTENPASVGGEKLADWQSFVSSFLKLAAKHPKKWVGKKKFAELRRDFNIGPSAEKLVADGWIVVNKEAGRKQFGWYSAGEMMGVSDSGPTPSPYAEATAPVSSSAVALDSRIVRAQQLLDEEPDLLEEKKNLEARLRQVSDRLGKIEIFKETLDALDGI